ncbi:MAG TPA: sensor histidine kinase, partial [Bacillota bacterium]|nr:sensor histidine kinase [Bacillota bacterium]
RPFQPKNEAWFQRCLSANGSPLVSGSFRFQAIANATGPHSYLFSVSRAILDTNNLSKVGVITIFADNTFLRNICNKTRAFPDERLIIVDRSGKIVYSPEELNIASQLSRPVTDGPLYRKINRSQAIDSFIFENRKYLTNIVNSQSGDWQLIRIIPEDTLYSSVRSIQQQFLWFTLLFVCLSLVLSVNMSYRITKPLQKLMLTMNRVQRGDLTVRFKVKYYDEVGHLGRSFNRMITQIDHLINRIHVSELRKQQAELNALQAQINPHFIYNTLESIRMQAELNDDPEAAKMIALLGNLLRYSVSKQNPVVTLAQELKNLQNYMRLQQYRFKDRYQLVINVPPQLLHVRMIKLLLQPLVENAIYHGMQHSTDKGYVTITASSNRTGLCLEVHDNGSGIPVEQLTNLNHNLNTTSGRPAPGGLGLTNVNERIKLTYGTEYGLSIWSKMGQGTTVMIQLPPVEVMNGF